jgi:hypothetical protein
MTTPYTIQRGDTLSALGNVEEIMRLNPSIKDPNKIFAGQSIKLPSSSAVSSPPANTPAIGESAQTHRQKLMDQIIKDEVSGNIRLAAHPDPIHGNKVPTIGIGTTKVSPGATHYLTSKGYDPSKVFTIGKGGQSITEEDARALTNLALDQNEAFLKNTFPNYKNWPEPAQLGTQNMVYQLGPTSFMGFKNMVQALKQDKVDWGSVADHGFDSKWANQTPNRAKRVTDLIRSADTWKPPTPPTVAEHAGMLAPELGSAKP